MARAAPTAGVIRFYRSAGEARACAWPADSGFRVASWRPAVDGPPAWGRKLGENMAWFALDRLGLFAAPTFEELAVRREDRLVHRLIVSPRWFRFPFMADDDLQIGAVWTAPEARRCGLAAMAIAEAHRRHAAPGRVFWYLAEEGNAASIGLAEACGYRLAGRGRRTRPLAIRAAGRFVMDPPAPPTAR